MWLLFTRISWLHRDNELCLVLIARTTSVVADQLLFASTGGWGFVYIFRGKSPGKQDVHRHVLVGRCLQPRVNIGGPKTRCCEVLRSLMLLSSNRWRLRHLSAGAPEQGIYTAESVTPCQPRQNDEIFCNWAFE